MILDSVSISVFSCLKNSWKTWVGRNVSECCGYRTYSFWFICIAVDVGFEVSERESADFLKKELGK